MAAGRLFGLVIAGLLAGEMIPSAGAETDNALIIKEITDAADRLCGYVEQSGSRSSTELSGDVKAELSGLAKRLANLGLAGTGKIESNEYEGIVQEQLGAALNDLRQCKIHIFDTLEAKLIASPAPTPPATPRNPNALYQDGEIVAEVQGARIDRGNGLVSFQSVRTQGNADRNREVEYQDWVLRCPVLLAPPHDTITGMFVGVAAGEECTIVRKASH